MKKLASLLLIIVVTGWIGWQNRIELIVWAAPKLSNTLKPFAPNKPIEWPQGPATAEVPANERPPNIILILTDDMGFNDISLYNGGAADGSQMTPNIDAIAHQGVRFDNGYAANAICAPSRASMAYKSFKHYIARKLKILNGYSYQVFRQTDTLFAPI